VTVILPPAREIALHEAHHGAAMILLGMVPKCVRVDFPNDTTAGEMEIDWGEDGVDRDKAKKVLIATIVGGTCKGCRGWDSWPVDPDRVLEGSRRDAEQAKLLAGYLGFDRVDWAHTVWQANQLADSTEFRHLAITIADELEDREVLYAADLRRIHDATRKET
jgi:hypothetical protein